MSAAKHKIGDRIRVEWIDYVGLINNSLSNAVPARAWTEGQLIRENAEYLVLAHSQFVDEKGNPDAKDPEGDYSVLIKGGIVKIKKI